MSGIGVMGLVENSNVFTFRRDTEHVDKRVFTIRCSDCTASFSRRLDVGKAVDPVLKSARANGWRVDSRGKSACCPECQCQKKDTMQASPAAIRQQIAMTRYLDDHFDAKTGTYAAGWSDQKIADETGLALSIVAKFREDGFGPLRNVEADKIATEVKALRGKLDADIAAAKEMIDQSAAEARERLDELEARAMRALTRNAA